MLKRFSCALLVLILMTGMFCVVNAQAATYYSRQIDFCDEYVTLRAKPSTSAASLCHVGVGEVVMATYYNSQFSYCCYNGMYGYILNDYLSSNIKQYCEGTFKIDNCDSWVSLRAMPDTQSTRLAKIPKGAWLDAIYYNDYCDGPYMDGAFAYVCYNGQYGFVLWDYIELAIYM